MIGYLKGTLLKKEEEKVLLLVNNIGYEILIPAFLMQKINAKKTGEELILYIYYQQTERQPKSILIGFETQEEKKFFQNIISVAGIGPLKAVKAINIPINEIAAAIETKNLEKLKTLKGIGESAAKKIIASLSGKMEKFATHHSIEYKIEETKKELKNQVMQVLINQLGHKFAEADKMVEEILKQNPEITEPEKLFEQIYKK
ncbi:MAG: Holliday junction DNA helicase RuvA [Deltaproteobacteria bacterium]|nr:Holliday junction DNA helicase RuvA [Deltaproteobacteria bacterium]